LLFIIRRNITRSSFEYYIPTAIIIITVIAHLDATLAVGQNIEAVENKIVHRFKINFMRSSEQLNTDIINELATEIYRQMSLLGDDIELVVLRKQNSIGVFLLCRSLDSIAHLEVLYSSEQLMVILERLFNALLSSCDPPSMINIERLVWMSANYHRCMSVLYGTAGKYINILHTAL